MIINQIALQDFSQQIPPDSGISSSPPPIPPSSQTPEPPPPFSGSQNTGMALISYLGILVLIPLLAAKDDPFVKFHIKQGLVLLAIEIISFVFLFLPFLFPIIYLGVLILSIIGIVNAVNGQMKELPVVGSFGNKFNL